MDTTAERGRLLYETKRYDLALKEFQKILSQQADDSNALAYTALCRLHLKRPQQASEAARSAVECAPENDFACYVSSFVEHRLCHPDTAEKAIQRARELRPQQAEYWGFEAVLRQSRRKWQEALQLAEAGLQLDADNRTCSLARARSLLKLGRIPEARAYLETLLSQDADNPLCQAHLGWTALEQNDRRTALRAFREALREDAELDWARAGLVEALRLGVPFYRFILQFYLKLGALNEEERLTLIVGEAYFAQVVTVVGCSTVVLFPLSLLYLTVRSVFIYLTWAARPITGFFLLLHPFGRFCLGAEEKREAVWAVPGMVGMAACSALAIVQWKVAWLVAKFLCVCSVAHVGAAYAVPSGWPRVAVAGVALTLLSLGAFSVVRLWHAPWDWIGWGALLVFLWARPAVTLVSTVLGIVTADPKKA